MKLTKSQKLLIKAGRIVEAYRHDLRMSQYDALHKLVISPMLEDARAMLQETLKEAALEANKERNITMTKEDTMNTPIGTPVLLKVWFADASDKYAIVEFKDENGNIKECRVAHSAIVKPKPEWFKN